MESTKPILTETKSLKAFLQGCRLKKFSEFFVKELKDSDGDTICTFFTISTEAGKTKGMVSQNVDQQVNCQEAINSDLEVSKMTSKYDKEGNLYVNDEGEPTPKVTWLIHNHQSDGVAGKDEDVVWD